MSTLMEDDIKRWTAKRKTALVLDIIQGKTTISEASRTFDLNPPRLSNGSMKARRHGERTVPSPGSQGVVREATARVAGAYGEASAGVVCPKKPCPLGNEDEK